MVHAISVACYFYIFLLRFLPEPLTKDVERISSTLLTY